MAKLKIHHTTPSGANVDAYVSPIEINSTHIGGTGGNNGQPVETIRIRYLRETTSAVDTGYIITQKGTKQFRVNNTSNANSTVVSLVNLQSAELATANTATILVNVAVISGANVANIGTGGGGYTDNQDYAYVTWASANVTGYSTPVLGHQVTGTGLTGNATIVARNTGAPVTNVTVALSTTQDVSAGQSSAKFTFAAKRISNKYVNDWQDNKWRYFLTDPYGDGTAQTGGPGWAANTLVQVDSA